MIPRSASRLAWSLWGLTGVIIVTNLFLTFLNRSHPGGDVRATSLISLVILVYATVGALIVARRQNAVGWILLALALATPIGLLIEQYSLRGLVTAPGSLPGTVYVATLQPLVPLNFALFGLLFLLFPDGRLPGRKWRPVWWLWGAGVVLVALGLLLRPGRLGTTYGGDLVNPLGVEFLRAPAAIAVRVGVVSAFLAAFVSVASLIVRFRRARGEERQQIKWVAYVGTAAAALLIGTFASSSAVSDAFFIAFFFTLTLGIPAALTVAILRYRLYDIDRIINRTLVYAVLTALLVGIYVGAAVGLGALVRSVTGQENNSVVIAASTLAVAAVFGPARRRIQSFIDRRFYRRKYDATRTLETFSARLREQVDLDSLSGELVGVVHDTMQPAHVSLWLRPAADVSRRTS
jgi:hypothetical protein